MNLKNLLETLTETFAATNARGFLSDDNEVSFRVGTMPGLLERVVVTLERDGTYRVRYVCMPTTTYMPIVDETELGVHAEQLAEVVRSMARV